MSGVFERALDRALPVPVRVEAVRYLGENRALTALVTLVEIAQREDEVDEVSIAAGHAIAHILNNGVTFDQLELAYLSTKAGYAIVERWQGEW